MKVKHTPGPWVVAEHPKSKNSVFTRTSQFIAAVDMGFAKPASELKANAHLISAAPELLIALEKAYGEIIAFLNEGDFKRNVTWDAGYIIDALAKAKGEPVKDIHVCAECHEEIRKVGDDALNYCESCQSIEGDTTYISEEEYEAHHG